MTQNHETVGRSWHRYEVVGNDRSCAVQTEYLTRWIGGSDAVRSAAIC